jgi:hypothetical protein
MKYCRKEIISQLITLLIIMMIVGIGCLLSCKSYEYTNEYINNPGTATMMQYEYVYNHHQLDSALTADSLPQNYKKHWIRSIYVDYETHEPITQYFYYKMNEYNEVNKIYKIELNIINTSSDTLFRYSRSSVNAVMLK